MLFFGGGGVEVHSSGNFLGWLYMYNCFLILGGYKILLTF